MPYATQEMLDAIQASTPNWKGTLKRIHYMLGSDFDKFMDLKYIAEPMPPEMVEEFERMHEEAKPRILEELIRIHVAAHGDDATAKHFEQWNDSKKPSTTGEHIESFRRP